MTECDGLVHIHNCCIEGMSYE